MTQRNPTNDRSMKRASGQESGGYTRKGASRAKPARESASSVHVVQVRGGHAKKSYEHMTKEEKKEERRRERAENDRLAAASNILMSHDPVYRRRRKIWWALLGAGLASTALAWIFFAALQGVSGTPGLISLIFAYVFIIGGFIWDWVKIRPIRRDTDAMVAAMNRKRQQEIIDEGYEEEQAKKAEKARRRGRAVPKDSVSTVSTASAKSSDSKATPAPDVEKLNPASALRDTKKRGRGKKMQNI